MLKIIINILDDNLVQIFHRYGYNTFEYNIYVLCNNNFLLIKYDDYYWQTINKPSNIFIVTNYRADNVNQIPYLNYFLN